MASLAHGGGCFLAQITCKWAMFFLCKTFHFQEMADVGRSKKASIFLIMKGCKATWFMEMLS